VNNNTDYNDINSYDFELPDSFIAKYPNLARDRCKLLIVNKKGDIIKDTFFYDIIDFLNKDDLLILNDSKVVKSKLFCININKNIMHELNLVEKLDNFNYIAFIKNRKKCKINDFLYVDLLENLKNNKIEKDLFFRIVDFIDDKIKIKFNKEVTFEILDKYGYIPIPPYLKRNCEKIDEIYYQTIYSKNYGSFASPTAGLHFTENLLEKIKEKGVTIEFLTLNVGAGTFSPIRTNNIINHKMHEELYFLSEQIVDKIIKTKEKNGKIIACGTTTLRALEGNFNKYNKLVAGYHTTDLFIKYGFKFNVVDSLITNFHTPKSTLLILVCTFAGYENIFKYYNYAKNNNYKFFSYGDAMFII